MATRRHRPTEVRDASTALAVARTYTFDPRKVSPDKPLTDQQRAFVKAWATGETVSSAAARTDTSVGVAYRLVQMPNILRVYQEEKRKYEEASQMTRKRVMDGLLEAVELAKLMAEPNAMVAGWREIGRMCGYYEPVKQRIDITVNAGAQRRLEQMTDADLLKLIYAPVAEIQGDDDGGEACPSR